MIRWLHISDLHLNSKNASTSLLRDELPHYLRKQSMVCDYVFCTGDIRTANEKPNDYTDEMADYLRKICDAVGTTTERLFMVPGNHDMDRDNIQRMAAIRRVKYQPEWTDNYDAECGLIDVKDMAAILKGETDFIKFLGKIYPKDRLKYYGNKVAPHFIIETDDFNVLHVDTTLIYAKNQEKTDLIVGTSALYEAVSKLNPCKPTILLTHYPFTALAQDEKKVLSTMLQKHEVRLWLSGHEHDHVVQRIHYIDQLQAGELRFEDKTNATFLIGEYDPKSGRGHVMAYTWFPEGWAQYPILDLDNKKVDRYEFTLHSVENDGLSREVVAAKEANKQYYHRLPEKVERNLLPAIEDGDSITSFEKLLDESWDTDVPHIIMLADGGMGKTTMLLDYCKNSSEPVLYIPAEQLVTFGISIEQYCISNIYENDINAFRDGLYTKYAKPTLTLFIDGLNEVDGKSERDFVLEIQRLNMLKGLRIVVTSRSNFTLRYSMPGYRATVLRPLDDLQVRGYFNDKEWERVQGTRALHQLLGNPMMVTVYKEICSVIDEFRDVEFLDWILPVKNSTDLLHDYYVAQLALMMKGSEVDGERMLLAAMCINDILPAIAYEYEYIRKLNLSLESFRELLAGILQKVIVDTKKLIPIQEQYRVEKLPVLNLLNVTDFITQSLRLMHRDKVVTAFPHQIYRDYLSAQWIIKQSRAENNVLELWNNRKIPYPVMTHIRYCSGEYWNDGIASIVHKVGMGMKDDVSKFLVDNLLDGFQGTETSGTPDYSGLWLSGHRLPDNPVGRKKIDLYGANIDMTTLGLSSDNLTLYMNLCLSEGGEFLAAIAVNDTEKLIQLNIFSVEDGSMVFHHELNKKISNMMFCDNRLFIVAGTIFVFTQEEDKKWHYIGEIGEAGKNVLRELKRAVISDNTLYLYYFSCLVTYDLRDCHRIDIFNEKFWEIIVEGIDITSLKKTVPWVGKNFLQKDVLSEVGNHSLLIRSYGDGGLVVESEGELQQELARGATLLMDAAISGDGKMAATLGFHIIGNKRKIQLWDLDNEKRMADLACPPMVKNIHLSETGKWLMGETDNKTWILNSENGEEKWYEEFFVSNHTGRLITYGDKVIRKKENSLYLFDLRSGAEELLKSPTENPKIVCFLPDKSLAAVDESGKTLYLWSTRDRRLLSQYMEGSEILSIQAIQSKPFIAVFTSDKMIRIYHTGVRQKYDNMQCLIKEAGKTIAKQMVAHQEIPLIANTDGRRHLETRFFEERRIFNKDIGQWKLHKFPSGKLVIDSDILDIAFNVHNKQLIAILANGKILFCKDKDCAYRDSFKIITAFNVNAYDFRGCICSDELKEQLKLNGAVI